MTEPLPTAPIRVSPRPMVVDDEGFVIDSWRKSWRTSSQARRESNRGYHAIFEDLVLRRLLGAERAEVLIAANHDDASEIVGWICHTPGHAPHHTPTIHYAYVRHRTRATGQPARCTGLLAAMLALVGVRDRLVYTFRPAERRNGHDNRPLAAEAGLLAAAARRGLRPAYEPILAWLVDPEPNEESHAGA